MNETANVGMMGMFPMIITLALCLLMLASMWRIFTKAGQPGWAILIPIYNAYVMLKVAGKPGWWLLLMLIPVVNLIVTILMLAGIAKNFGKGVGYVLGLIFFPILFYPMLAFGDAQYRGVAG